MSSTCFAGHQSGLYRNRCMLSAVCRTAPARLGHDRQGSSPPKEPNFTQKGGEYMKRAIIVSVALFLVVLASAAFAQQAAPLNIARMEIAAGVEKHEPTG